MRKITLILSTLAALVIAAPVQATTVVFSEDFESGLGAFSATGQAGINNGFGYVPCCSVTGSDLNNHFVAFGSGGQPSGSITASFDSVLGQLYTVNFDYMGVGTSGSDSIRLEVVGIFVETIDQIASTNLDFLLPTQFPESFFGTGMPITLIFSGEGSADADAILDDVIVTTDVDVASVPEPDTWAMMLFGFGALGVCMRRRRAASVHQLA